MKKIILFASGSGSNVENIVNYFSDSSQVSIEAVFTNNSNAGVIERCERLRVNYKVFKKSEFTDGTVLLALENSKPDLIVLAGFLLLLPEGIINAFESKIVNIHPSLLPAYGGKGMFGMFVHEAIAKNKDKETGITIHFVNKEFDKGEVIFQSSVEVKVHDAESIAAQIHELEFKFFPIVIEELLCL